MSTTAAAETARLRTLIRGLTLAGGAYFVLASLALTRAAVADRHVLLGWIVAAFIVPLAVGGFLAALLIRARRRLDQARVEPLPWPPGSHGLICFVTGLVPAAALACLIQQVRDDLRLRTPVTAVLDACEHVGKAPQCAGHWTVDDRTYSSDDLAAGGEEHHAGDTLTVLYAPTEPSYIRHPGSDIGAYGIAGAVGLVSGLGVLGHHLPREIRERRTLRAALDVDKRAPSAGS